MATYPDLTFPTTLNKKGRVTIPDNIRKAFNIKEGDQVFLTVQKIIPKKEA